MVDEKTTAHFNKIIAEKQDQWLDNPKTFGNAGRTNVDTYKHLIETYPSDNLTRIKGLECLNQIEKNHVVPLLFNNKDKPDHEGMLSHVWDIQPFFYDNNGFFWLWDWETGSWNVVEEIRISLLISKTCPSIDVCTQNVWSKVRHILKHIGLQKKPKDLPIELIQFKHTLINYKTGECINSSPEYFSVNPIDISLSDSSKCPVIDSLFESWVGKGRVQTLYEIFAYCLLRDYPISKIFLMVGGGRNGKSTFLDLLNRFIGESSSSSSSLQELTNNRFAKSLLYQKLVCTIAETDHEVLKGTSLLKQLSGNDKITFEFKGKTGFLGKSYAKLIVCSNSLPETTDKTAGWYRRNLILNWDNKFKEKNDVLGSIPVEEYGCLARKCILILKELLNKGKFHNEGSIKDKRKAYEEKSRPLINFIKDFCLVREGKSVAQFDFLTAYNKYASDSGHRRIQVKEIGNLLIEEGYECKYMHIRHQANAEHPDGYEEHRKYVIGLRLLEGLELYSKLGIKKEVDNMGRGLNEMKNIIVKKNKIGLGLYSQSPTYNLYTTIDYTVYILENIRMGLIIEYKLYTTYSSFYTKSSKKINNKVGLGLNENELAVINNIKGIEKDKVPSQQGMTCINHMLKYIEDHSRSDGISIETLIIKFNLNRENITMLFKDGWIVETKPGRVKLL